MMKKYSALQSLEITTEKLSNRCSVHLVNIPYIGPKLRNAFDSVLVEICEGKSNSEISTVKKRLVKFFNTKVDSTTELGAIAEFVCHAVLKKLGFKQEFLFLNLEEGSIKKGFDGFYTLGTQNWLFESKSGTISTANISHESKIKEAYSGLKNKVSGKKVNGNPQNDPWGNAYNHARVVGTKKSICDQLKLLSDNYVNEKYTNISEHNIIPGSTIFFENTWAPKKQDQILKDISAIIDALDCKALHIVCVNKKTKELFLKYLNM